MIDRCSRRRLPGVGTPLTGLLILAVPLLWLPLGARPAAADEAAGAGDSCVNCHSDPNFLVTNKKLYDYYQAWQVSAHKQEEVTCSDCHGGNPEAADKKGAHGGEVGGEAERSAVNFKNIPLTCGRCHEEIYEGYRKSDHFQHLEATGKELQGPNCVTCHESMNTAVLNVVTVKEACARCHNEENDNHPEIPERAKFILNRFLSIHRFYRYLSVRLEPAEAREFFQQVDKQIHALSIQWHNFDLGEVEHETWKVVDLLRAKRDMVKRRLKESRNSESEGL